MSCTDMHIMFSGFRDDALKAQIEAAEGHVHSNMVKSITHMLVKPGAKASKKQEAAKEKGIEIIDLNDFLEEHDFVLSDKKTKKKSDDEDENSDDENKAEKAEKKPKKKAEAKLVIEVASDDEKEEDDTENIDLIYAIMHTLKTKKGKKEALQALKTLSERIKA